MKCDETPTSDNDFSHGIRIWSQKWNSKSKIQNSPKKGKIPKVIYGGSVNEKNISQFSNISQIDGFLIGGASQDPKKFIDIIKKTYN